MEQILVAQRRGLDTKHAVRTNHLVVRAINEILLMIRHLSSSPLVPEERQHMKTLQSECVNNGDQKLLFLFVYCPFL